MRATMAKPGRLMPLVSAVVVMTAAPGALAGGPDWLLELEQGRLSAMISGDVLDDSRQFTETDTDAARSWARSRLRLSGQTRDDAGSGLEWSAFMVQEAHVQGYGAKAATRLNQDSGLPGTRYPFAVDSVQHRRWGVAVRRSGQTEWPRLLNGALRWHAGVQLFAVDRFKSISAQGLLQDATGGDLALQATSRSDELGGTSTFVQPDKALGWGLTLDAGVQGGHEGQVQWALAVSHLGPRVRLDHVLGEDKTIDTNTVSFDEDGYVNFAPAVSGRYVDREASLRIEPEWVASLSAPINRYADVLVGGVWHGARQEFSLGYRHRWGAHQVTVTGYALRDMPRSVGLRWDFPHASLGWRGDQIDAGKARIWVLEGGLRF